MDSSPEFYEKIISTRTYQHRLDTLEAVRDAGLKVCSGGIVGMGETRRDRAGMLATLANLPEHPQSVPINQLVQVQGTPLAEQPEAQQGVDGFEFVRTIAVARILMPAAQVRLSAGREAMNDELQALAFLAAQTPSLWQKLLTPAIGVERDAPCWRARYRVRDAAADGRTRLLLRRVAFALSATSASMVQEAPRT